jgi:ssDNA-binding Zn-finger/Zn-ribbon topoisomerase 1
MNYLKPRQYYEDEYDKLTISICKEHIETFKNNPVLSPISDLHLYFVKGSRFADRAKSIQESIDRHTQMDNLINNFAIPYVFCFSCKDPMDLTYKMIDHGAPKIGLLYYMECKKCMVVSKFDYKGRHDIVPWQCPKCKARLNTKTTRKQNKITTTKSCKECEYKNVDILDLSYKKKKIVKEVFDEQQFIEDRLRFCMSPSEGEEYLQAVKRIHDLNKLMDSINNGKGQKNPKIKALTVKEAMKLVNKVLKDNGFESTKISEPLIKDEITFKFSAVDGESRNSRTAKSLINSKIRDKLKNTNWDLYSKGITYRLGVIEGGVRGREVPVYETVDYDEVIL